MPAAGEMQNRTRQGERVALVAMTAMGELTDPAGRARAAGCDAVVLEPFELHKLLATLRRCVEARSP